jgi:transposase-like protein
MSTTHLYQVMPDLSPEEYAALKADIAANGVQVPIEVDEEGNIVDGFHRKQICDELGRECPTTPYFGHTEEEKLEHARRLNLKRRHLTREQKIELAGTWWEDGWTQDRIAQTIGVSQSTVANWVPEFIKSGKLPSPTVQGKDGKPYRRTKTRRRTAKPAEANRPETPQSPSDADDGPAPALKQQEPPQLRDTHAEARSRGTEPSVASGVPDAQKTPPLVSGEWQTPPMEQMNVPLGSSQIPSPEDHREAHWVDALQAPSGMLETLRVQGDLLPSSDRWAPEVRAQGMARIRHMQEILMALASVVGAAMRGAADQNGHDGAATPSPVPPPIADEVQAQGNCERVTVQSAEASVGDAADGDQRRSGGAGEGSSPRDQVLPGPEEAKPSPQAPLAALRSPARPAARKDAPARTRTRHSKQAVANGHASSVPPHTAPDHPTPDASQSQGEAATIGNPPLRHDEDAVKPDADAARPLGASAPADVADSASVDLTRCGSCGGTQFIPTPKESGRIYCECRSVYNPLTGHWAPGQQDKRQRPPAPLPATET